MVLLDNIQLRFYYSVKICLNSQYVHKSRFKPVGYEQVLQKLVVRFLKSDLGIFSFIC